MLDVAACNRELRNRVADRLGLGLLRQFGGAGSQSDNLIHFWIQGDGKAWPWNMAVNCLRYARQLFTLSHGGNRVALMGEDR